MTMIEEYWYEFSKLYARLMRLEIYIKRSAITSSYAFYKEDILIKFQDFFNNRRRKKRYTNPDTGKCKFNTIIYNKFLNDKDKFTQLVNLLYFSDLLHLVLKMTQFKVPEIVDKFYFNKPAKIKILEDKMKDLINLRNNIAHYNFEEYIANKSRYLDTLLLFEIHVGYNIAGILELPKLKNKSTMSILEAIYKFRPDLILETTNAKDPLYFNKHRMLLTLFDDIALYNGVSPNKLPTPWSVLRGMYKLKARIKKELKNQEDLKYETFLNNPKYPLFQELN